MCLLVLSSHQTVRSFYPTRSVYPASVLILLPGELPVVQSLWSQAERKTKIKINGESIILTYFEVGNQGLQKPRY